MINYNLTNLHMRPYTMREVRIAKIQTRNLHKCRSKGVHTKQHDISTLPNTKTKYYRIRVMLTLQVNLHITKTCIKIHSNLKVCNLYIT